MEIATKEALAELKQELINAMWGGLDPTPDVSRKSKGIPLFEYVGSSVRFKSYTANEDGYFLLTDTVTGSMFSLNNTPWNININGVRIGTTLTAINVIFDTTNVRYTNFYSESLIPLKKGDVLSISSSGTPQEWWCPGGFFFPCRGNSAKTN